MSENRYSCLLTKLVFPDDLPGQKSNFRMLVEIRFFSDRNQPGEIRVIWPGFESYWECDRNKAQGPSYVRGESISAGGEKTARVDLSRVDPWDRTLLLAAADLHSVRITLFDVDRKGLLESVSGTLMSVLDNLSAPVSSLWNAPLNMPSAIEAALLEKLAAGENSTDKILFRQSVLCPPVPRGPDPVVISLNGEGCPGKNGYGAYRVEMSLQIL